MPVEISDLDAMQTLYKDAVEEWIAAIRLEERLASINHKLAEVDQWENADLAEEEARTRAKSAKETYEAALREKFFNF
ncbi:MAG TPA: hypothetical protein VIY53_06410 [Acidobacteriaceae bacterium]